MKEDRSEVDDLLETDRELTRRDYLKTAGAAGATAMTAGCIFGSGAPEIRDQARSTEDALQSQIPWGSYKLNYISDSVEVGIERVGSTGVENANTYRVNSEVALADNSDDLDGWLSTQALTREFFSLLNNGTYDIFAEIYEGFEGFSPPNQPSHRNQVVSYSVKVEASQCSYIDYNLSSQNIEEVLSSRQAYANYFDIEAGNLGVVQDSGRLGLGIVCDDFLEDYNPL